MSDNVLQNRCNCGVEFILAINITPLKPMHTEGVAFVPRKSPRARCAKSNILAQVLNQSVVHLERRVESLAVCMPQLNNTCANLYAKDLTLSAERQRPRCAWAITAMHTGVITRLFINM